MGYTSSSTGRRSRPFTTNPRRQKLRSQIRRRQPKRRRTLRDLPIRVRFARPDKHPNRLMSTYHHTTISLQNTLTLYKQNITHHQQPTRDFCADSNSTSPPNLPPPTTLRKRLRPYCRDFWDSKGLDRGGKCRRKNRALRLRGCIFLRYPSSVPQPRISLCTSERGMDLPTVYRLGVCMIG